MQKIMNPITIISKLFLHFINAPAGLIQILDVGRLPTLQGKTLGLRSEHNLCTCAGSIPTQLAHVSIEELYSAWCTVLMFFYTSMASCVGMLPAHVYTSKGSYSV